MTRQFIEWGIEFLNNESLTWFCKFEFYDEMTTIYSSESRDKILYCSMVGWLFGFYGISTFVGYLTPNRFLCKKSILFQIILFSMSTQFNFQKNISISNYSVYSNNSNSANFVYTQLNVKTVLYIAIQFSVSRVSMTKTVPF